MLNQGAAVGRMLAVTAPAKVNLHLFVGDIRQDGYHTVRTVLHTLELCDYLLISEAASDSFTCSPDLGLAAHENLAFRAAQAMKASFSRNTGVGIELQKRIPAGAGLGGASSDAAAVIMALAELWGIPKDSVELREVARSLGADVPFFLEGGAALFGERGDVFERSLPPLIMPIVLAKPDEPVPTGQAYEALDMLHSSHPSSPVSPDSLVAALGAGDPEGVGTHLYNSMTESSVTIVSAIAALLEFFEACEGMLGCAMAGSGSACFAIFRTDKDAMCCAEEAAQKGWWSVATRTCVTGCQLREV